MQYKKLMEGMQRSYKSFGNWGIGATILTKRHDVYLKMDICCDSHVIPFVCEKYDSIPEAKLEAVRYMRKMINDIGKWIEE